MNTESDSSPQHKGSAPPPARAGQVCDRCRTKKVRCDGAAPACGNCVAAGVTCEVSATLRRKTKIRGFATTDEALIRSLRAENAELREKLLAETESNRVLRAEVDRERQLQRGHGRPRKLTRTAQQSSSRVAGSPLPATSSDAGASLPDKSIYMIKHMGRLVHDEAGTGRFAGSTTGVHFVLCVEEAVRQSSLSYATRFPESSFSLYLLQPTTAGGVDLSDTCRAPWPQTSQGGRSLVEDARELFPYPSSYYVNQVDEFIAQWQSFCPVIVRKQFISDMHKLLIQLREPARDAEVDYITLQVLTLILAINQVGDSFEEGGNATPEPVTKRHVQLAYQLLNRTMFLGNLNALQSLILFAFYIQISGQSLWLVQLNGLMVRMAHSLGLHRHDRRFKHSAGEVELRRRMWWWIYTFDKITSVVHGLPRLIADTDVDNDMPTDCELDDISAHHLSHPLPGEITPVFFFNQYVLLGKKLSTILEQLYTTTARRGGAEKIVRLDRDLRVWNHAFNAYPHVNTFEIGSFSRRAFDESNNEGHAYINSWLQLMANIAMVLIHRPGLTFDASTPEFATSLKACIASCTTVIELLDDRSFGWWLQNKCPSGPALVFQCALMHIYLHCAPTIPAPVGSPTRTASRNILAKALAILESFLPGNESTSPANSHVEDSRTRPLQDAIQTVRALENALPQDLHLQSRDQAPLAAPNAWQDIYSGQSMESAANIEMWNGNALESLNNLDSFEWMFDEISPFPGPT